MQTSTSTYLMSYPGADWQIRGAENFRSTARAPTNPRKALREWIALCDAILRASGHILVMQPPSVEPPLTGMIYTANAGQIFRSAAGPAEAVYLLSNMSVAHRQPERDFVRAFLGEAGLRTEVAKSAWEGQADLQSVGGNRFIATWGVRSVRPSLDEVRPLLPPGARLLDLQIREPFFHGDTCLNTLVNKAGDVVLLAHPDAFVGTTLAAVRQFVGNNVEVMGVDREDALGYACNALCVNGSLLVPTGLSANLRGQLARRGFAIEELDLSELFGKGGGGPRCLVNDLRGIVMGDGAPDYASRRDELLALVDSYPEAPPEPAPGDGGAAKPPVTTL